MYGGGLAATFHSDRALGVNIPRTSTNQFCPAINRPTGGMGSVLDATDAMLNPRHEWFPKAGPSWDATRVQYGCYWGRLWSG